MPGAARYSYPANAEIFWKADWPPENFATEPAIGNNGFPDKVVI